MQHKNQEQLTLHLSEPKSFNADEFITLPCNQVLVEQLLDAAHGSSPLTIVFGGDKSGKTHLAHVWADYYNANFLPDNFLKIDEIDFPELAKLVSQGAIVIDDIDKKPICEKTIFHIINLAKQAGTPLLFTSSKPLLLWQIQLPDLLSRLKAAKHLEIPSPDDLLVQAILIKSFSEKQLNVAETVINYILPRVDRSVAAVTQIVDKIDEYALKQNKPITRSMVAKMFEIGLI